MEEKLIFENNYHLTVLRTTTMRHTLLLLIVALSSFTLIAQPKLSVSNDKIDLGVIYNGAIKTAEIKLTNTGKDTLKIVSVQPSCGCTTVKQPKSALAPGESDFLKVEFNSTGFRGPSTKYVNITTNDPAKPNVTVTLTADVKEELQPTNNSSVLWLGTVPMGKTITENLAFKNLSNKPLKIKGVASKNPSITAKFEPTSVQPLGELKVTFTVKSEKEGYVNEELFIETDSKNQPRVPVRISFVGVKPS